MKQQSADFGQERRIKFGGYLRKLRGRRKQKDVAPKLGLKPEQLSMIERGKRAATEQQLIMLAVGYNVPLEQILREKYWPQLSLLTGIIKPAELARDLISELDSKDQEEVTRYAAFLLLKRSAEALQR
jgi:transcriptional regulator with XRE-family HTH domain